VATIARRAGGARARPCTQKAIDLGHWLPRCALLGLCERRPPRAARARRPPRRRGSAAACAPPPAMRARALPQSMMPQQQHHHLAGGLLLSALLLADCVVATAVLPAVVVAESPPPLVVVAANATAIESRAAHELAYFLGQLVASDAPVQVVTPVAARGKPQLGVGPSAATALGVAPTDLSFTALGAEGFLASSNRTTLLRTTGSIALSGAIGAGDASTGTLYAVHHLLRHLGVRFYAWDELYVPTAAPWKAHPLALDLTVTPSFEYRDVEGWSAMAHVAENASRSSQADYFHMNGYTQGEAGRGNDHASVYATPPGFVHTSYNLFPGHPKGNATFPKGPPQDLFRSHNGWFWPHNDSSVYGQLCWSNHSLVEYLKSSALQMLSTQPHARIISISQNDNVRPPAHPIPRCLHQLAS
jgi:hypothetical protein